ncbi:hypothetical protein [Ancylobacter rudongensis]|uniref:Uncharacterized protein n=1 Tax=Ancylobacter rudongensis TaxID=177413 RepID=A0A1G4UP66_9HYPH|nr:hypothetical protein [Ancylobacter rudongensis]SCW95357.1 hypothetical protein SAMN05660859_0006 [Ancylobacter rudongensis]
MISKHFVEFHSPGTFLSEVSTREVESWNVELALEMAKTIKEGHGAVPYGFCFTTRSRGDKDLDSSESARSHFHYLGGTVRTYEQVVADDLPDEKDLRAYMKRREIDRIIVNTNSWKTTRPLEPDDVVLEWPPAPVEKPSAA